LKVQTDNPAAKPTKRYDLEDRTLRFSKNVIQFVNGLPRTIANIELSKQLIRSAGSVGANYIEANEALGKKDFVLRARIARKEAKETRYWLELVEYSDAQAKVQKELVQEATELLKILSTIIAKPNSPAFFRIVNMGTCLKFGPFEFVLCLVLVI